jgi:hypothetical protein
MRRPAHAGFDTRAMHGIVPTNRRVERAVEGVAQLGENSN